VAQPRLTGLRQRHALDEYRWLRRIARRLGYHLVPANYYSPIPDLALLPESVFRDPAPMPGLDWDTDRQLAFLTDELGAERLAELNAPLEPPGVPGTGYHYRNEFFHALDADVLHAIVRWLKPATVLEIGSGYSTLVIAGAAGRIRAEGGTVEHEVHDPFPSPVLSRVRHLLELRATPAQAISPERIAELRSGDLLFIDTTHAVKPGGDVVHLLLAALPRVASGVVIQIHDVFRPFEYPRILPEHYGAYWQEHHLLQAFLAFNSEFEVLCANHALFRQRREAVRELVPALEDDMTPSSLWLRRR
jgi:hypothetical protein